MFSSEKMSKKIQFVVLLFISLRPKGLISRDLISIDSTCQEENSICVKFESLIRDTLQNLYCIREIGLT